MSFNTQDQGNEGGELTFKVGEREYDATAATTKIENADAHISKLEAENAEFKNRMASLEAKLEQSTKLDDALETFKAKRDNETENVQPEQNTTGLSEEQIAVITQQKMEEFLANQSAKQQQETAEQIAKQTYQETANTLVGIYGDKVDEAISKKAQDMGVPASDLFNMANNPVTAKLLLETMTPKGGHTEKSPTGGFNTASLYGEQEGQSLIGSLDGKQLTSSTILEALNANGANY